VEAPAAIQQNPKGGWAMPFAKGQVYESLDGQKNAVVINILDKDKGKTGLLQIDGGQKKWFIDDATFREQWRLKL
jgi:hypothetical protein